MLFVVLSVFAIIGVVVWLFVFGEAHSRWLTVALAGITAGILGNLYDRLGLHGVKFPWGHPEAGQTAHAVRDWILFQWNDALRWPNFNIADCMLVCGAALLVLHAAKGEPKTRDESAAKPS